MTVNGEQSTVNGELLFFRSDIKRYFLVIREGADLFCSKCKKVLGLGRPVYLHKSYSKILPFKKGWFCSHGCRSSSKTRDQDEKLTALLSMIIPDHAKLISDWPVELKDAKDVTVWDSHKLQSDKTKDNTIHAGRESIAGGKIGDPKFLDHNKEANKQLSEPEFKEILKLEKKKKPALPKHPEDKNVRMEGRDISKSKRG